MTVRGMGQAIMMAADRPHRCGATFAPETKQAVTDHGVGIPSAEEGSVEEPRCLGICEREPGADTCLGCGRDIG